MGLDQFAFKTSDAPNTDVNFTLPDNISELHYWRKHPNLHGWMHELYIRKGGSGQFNCDPLVLTAEDLDMLEAAILRKDLPDTAGFFFGETTGEEQDDDLNFVAKARRAIASGFTVIYDSWW